MSSLLGAGAPISGSGSPAGRLLNVQYFTSKQQTTYTPTAGTNTIYLVLQGAGGGGNGSTAPAASNVSIGQAGGAGAYLEKLLTSNFSGKQIAVGTGGQGGTAGNNPGTAGGNTIFDAAGGNYIAGGGAAGNGLNSAAFSWIVMPGALGGTASSGNLNVPGNSAFGNFSLPTNGSNPSAFSQGGSSRFGQGGTANSVIAQTAVAGGTGTGNGSGGSGGICYNGNASQAGGSGTDGLCIIYEYS